jgi:hypothetical protein
MPDLLTSAPPKAAPKPGNKFRDVISLLAIVVTLTIGLLASIQRVPVFAYKVEVGFLLLVSGPLSGLWHISRAVNQTPTQRVHLYTPAATLRSSTTGSLPRWWPSSSTGSTRNLAGLPDPAAPFAWHATMPTDRPDWSPGFTV